MGQLHLSFVCFLLSSGFIFPNIHVNYMNSVATVSHQSRCVAIVRAAPPAIFHDDYQEDIQQAMDFLALHQSAIQSISNPKHNGISPDICRKTIAVVFPELIRYHRFRDLLETEALEQLYVRFGPKAADFSIGPFQMKPSFIELLEQRISADACLQDQFSVLFFPENTSIKDQRKMRVQRLQNFSWQLRYAVAYVTMMENFPPFPLPTDELARLQIIATAYNYGFDRPAAEIKAWQNKKAFPYGLNYPIAQFPYADLSLYIYRSSLIQDDYH